VLDAAALAVYYPLGLAAIKVRIPTHRGQDSERSRTAFRRIADRIPNDRGQRSDDRGQWWMIG